VLIVGQWFDCLDQEFAIQLWEAGFEVKYALDNFEEVYLNDLEGEDYEQPFFPEDEWDDNDEELTDTFDFILNNNTLR